MQRWKRLSEQNGQHACGVLQGCADATTATSSIDPRGHRVAIVLPLVRRQPAAILDLPRLPCLSHVDMTFPHTRRRACWTMAAALLLFCLSDRTSRLRASPADTTWTIGNSRIQATFRIASSGLLISRVVDPATGAELGTAEEPDSTATINGDDGGDRIERGRLDVALGRTGRNRHRQQPRLRVPLLESVDRRRTLVCGLRGFADHRDLDDVPRHRVSGGHRLQSQCLAAHRSGERTALRIRPQSTTPPAAPVDDAFALQTAAVTAGMSLTFDESNRSTEQFLPMIAGDAGALEFFGGLAWSGSWQIVAQGLATADASGDRRHSAGQHHSRRVTPARDPARLLRVRARRPRRRGGRAARLCRPGHPSRPAVPAARHRQHVVLLRHEHRRRDDEGRDDERRAPRRGAVRDGRRLVSRGRRRRRLRRPDSEPGNPTPRAFPTGSAR